MVTKKFSENMKRIIIWVTVGASAGLLIWLYDYEFLLNAGGPETPISDYFRSFASRIFRSEPYGSAAWYAYYLSPLAFLMLVGGVIGYLIQIAIRKMRH
jgi:hypothetical protein